MNFLERIFERLDESGGATVVQEIRGQQLVPASGDDLLSLVAKVRGFLTATGLRKGDRCALLAPNSIRWVAADLALMTNGVIVVPLYVRQAPAELATMVRDSGASRILCESQQTCDALRNADRDMPPISLFEEAFAHGGTISHVSSEFSPRDPVTIIYTSGTSGEPKGVVLNIGNVDHMISCTTASLDKLMGAQSALDRVFHWTPLNFAASWISLLSYLSRSSVISLSTDLTKLADEMRIAAPNYFLNVPTLLERVRTKIEGQIRERGGWIAATFSKAKYAYLCRGTNDASFSDRICLAIANVLIFPTIRKSIGSRLKALICGSAPLSVETQKFFMMLGIPVLQAYGLTETTAICTLDDPALVEPGYVGAAIPGIEMKVGENQEILVRGPNVFPGYWNRPQETAAVIRDGWFHTGDQGEVNSRGNWKITGRIKNLIILNSGHNIAPEPIEEELAALLPQAAQIVVVGNGRSYLAAIITTEANSNLTESEISTAVDKVNSRLPHYKQIRAFHLERQPFTIESGLLTAMGKLKRDAIAAKMSNQIEELYRKRVA
ncbi:MAG TPA: AMP-binding protein [Candidatus Acidoferrales bacterium]|jgi:long-chain acyl-CoA synthetase|nr:AMP-binding protein [Candidatus Acidoferrales bacterium]